MSREPRTQREADRQAYYRHVHGERPKFEGGLLDEEGRRWFPYTSDPYFFPPPPKPLLLYACYFGSKLTSSREEVDPPEVGTEVNLGEETLYLEAERSNARRRPYIIFEVRRLSINV